MKNGTWPRTDDAGVWAEKFIEYKNRNRWTLEEIDEALMLGWFANAMEAAKIEYRNS